MSWGLRILWTVGLLDESGESEALIELNKVIEEERGGVECSLGLIGGE